MTHFWLKGHIFIFICVLLGWAFTAPIPSSTFSALPGSILYGGSINFKVDFDNTGDALGYGPFVDVVVPYDTVNNKPTVTITSASFLDMTITPVVFKQVTSFSHPYTLDAGGQKIVVSLAANEVFYTYRLPFLSFASSQPIISLQITSATDSNITLSAFPLRTRAGFTYGDKPLDTNPSIISSWVNSSVSVGEVKSAMTFSSQTFMMGPEYVYNCTQLFTFKSAQLTLNGTLIIYIPCGVRLNKIESATAGSITLDSGAFNVSQNYKDRISLTLNNNTSYLDNVYVTFSFYIDYNDTIKCGYGSTAWSPLIYPWSVDLSYYFYDPACNCIRQYVAGQTATVTAVPLRLTSAIARTVDVNAAGNTPGDTFQKTITFEISDSHYCFNHLRLYETLNDGLMVNTSNYQITVTGTNIVTPIIDSSMVWDTVTNSLQSSLNVSQLVHPTTRLQGPVSIQFKYTGKIQDKYLDDSSVVHGTTLGSLSMITLFQYSCNFTDMTAGINGSVSSASSIKTINGIIDMTTYAIDGVILATQLTKLYPTQVVTLRLTYATPTTDFNNLNFEFYPPHPVFIVPATLGWSTGTSIPPINSCGFGPLHTLAVTPTVTSSVVQNNIYFNFGSKQDPLNTQTKVDILCTLKITDNKFPNDLQIATLGKSSEEQVGMQVDWLAYQLAMPSVAISKKIVSSSNSNALYNTSPSKTFTAPGSAGLRWTGSLISADIATLANSVSGCDAGDFVTIAVVLENTGSSPAHDVIVLDAFSTDYVLAANPNIAVYNGRGQVLTWSGNLFSGGLQVSPGLTPSLSAIGGIAGENILVITYDLQLKASVQETSTYSVGLAQLLQYAAVDGGADFATPDISSETVSISTAAPILVGSLDYSSLPTTVQSLATANVDDLAPGEYFRMLYRVTVPEGVTPGASFTVSLPTASTTRMRMLNGTVTLGSALTTVSNTLQISDTNSDGINDRAVFTFGDISNQFDNVVTDADVMLIYVTGIVVNTASRTSSVIIAGTLNYHSNRQQVNNFNVDIVEPTDVLTMTGPTSNVDGMDTLTFIINVSPQATTNSPSYGMVITNTLPAEYTFVSGQTTISGISAGKYTLVSGNSSTDTSLVLNVPLFLTTDPTIVITTKVLVLSTIAPGLQVTNPVTVFYYSADEVATAKSYTLTTNVKTTMALPSVTGVVNWSSLTETVKAQYSTSVEDLAIGEDFSFLVTYRFTEGTSVSSSLQFLVPRTTGSYLEMFACSIVSVGANLSYPPPLNATSTITNGLCNINLGTVVNTPDNVATAADTIVVLVTSRVPIDRSNAGSATLKGSTATITYQVTQKRTATINVEFVEPTLTLAKSTSTTGPVDADDTVTVTLTLTNPSASSKAAAYAITITDTILASLVIQGSPTVTTGTATVSTTGDVITISATKLTLGQSIVVTYTTKVAAAIQTGTPFTVPGASASYYSNSVTAMAKSYTATASSTSVSVFSPTFTFSIYATSNALTTSEFYNVNYPDVSICETVTLQVTISFPEGRTVNPQLIVTMPVPFVQIQNAVIQSLGTSLTPSSGVNIAYSDSNDDIVSDRLTVTFGDMSNAANNLVNSNDNLVVHVTGVVLPTASETGTALTNTATLNYNTATSSSLNVYFEVVEPRLVLTLSVWNLYDDGTADDEISDGNDVAGSFVLPAIGAVARGYDNGDKVKFLVTISHMAASKAPAYNLALTTLDSPILRFFSNSVFVNSTAQPVITYLQDGFSVAIASLERTAPAVAIRYTKYVWNFNSNFTVTETVRVQYGQCSNTSQGNVLESTASASLPRKYPKISLLLVAGPGSTTPIPAPQSTTIGNQTTVLIRIKLPEMVTPLIQLEVAMARGLSIVSLPTYASSNNQSISFSVGQISVSEYGDVFTVNFTNVINANTQNDQDEYLYVYYNAIILDLPSVGSGTERPITAIASWADGNDVESLSIIRVIEPALKVQGTVNQLIVSTGENITALVTVSYSNKESLAYDLLVSNPIEASLGLDLASVVVTGNPDSVTVTSDMITAYWSVLTIDEITISFTMRVLEDINTPLLSVGQVTAMYSTMPGDLRTTPISQFNSSSVERLYLSSPNTAIGVLYRLPGKDVGVMGCWNQSQIRTNDQYIRTHPGGCAFGVLQWDSNCIQDSFGYLSQATLQLYVRKLVLPYGQPTCLRVYRDNLFDSVWDEKTATYSNLIGMTANVLLGRLDITTALEDEFIEIPLTLQDMAMDAQAIENLVIRQCPYIGTVPSTTNITHLTLIDSKEGEHPPQMILRYSSECSPDTCVNGRCVVRYSVDGPREFCACASGWMGEMCTVRIDSVCNNRFNSVELLATDNVPILDPSSTFTCSALDLRIRGPLVYNRTHTVIYWMNNRRGNAMCDYPGYFWNKDFTTNCEDLWSSSIPWVIGNRCGWMKIDDPDWYIYETFLTVEHNDYLGDFRGYDLNRITRHVFRMQVRFPKRTTVTTTIDVFSKVRLLAAITFQAYQVTVQQGVIVVTTSLQWPFMLDLPQLTDAPYPLTGIVSEKLSGQNCGTVNGTSCSQQFALAIDPNTACRLNGLYRVNFTVVCNPALVGACPLDDTTNKAQLALTILSEDICSQLALEVGLSAAMEPYEDETLTIKKNVFLPGQRVYFLANVTVMDAAAELSSVNLTEFTFGPYQLVAQNALTPRGTATNTRFERRGGNWVSLSFLVPSDLNIPVDSAAPFTAEATLAVRYKYVNSDTQEVRRFTQQDGADYEQQLYLESSVNLRRTDPNGSATPTGTPGANVPAVDVKQTSAAIHAQPVWICFFVIFLYILL